MTSLSYPPVAETRLYRSRCRFLFWKWPICFEKRLKNWGENDIYWGDGQAYPSSGSDPFTCAEALGLLTQPLGECYLEVVRTKTEFRIGGDGDVDACKAFKIHTCLEAPLCDDDSTNYCHRYADCTVEDVRLKCICKPGTNDTSHGTGKVCDGIPNEDEWDSLLCRKHEFWSSLK